MLNLYALESVRKTNQEFLQESKMKSTDLVDQLSLRDDLPDFDAGDTLKVHVRVVEGNRERVQIFEGVVISRRGSGIAESFTVEN